MQQQTQAAVAPGFARPVHDSQRVFRCVLAAMSRPGTIEPLPAAPGGDGGLGSALSAVLLTLADLETPLWLSPDLDTAEARAFLRFHCGAPLVADPGEAAFAVCGDHRSAPDLEALALGTPAYPDRSTTVLVRVPELAGGPEGLILTGPGIASETRLAAPGLDPAFIRGHRANRPLFPMGFDIILAGPDGLACLPRSTDIRESAEEA